MYYQQKNIEYVMYRIYILLINIWYFSKIIYILQNIYLISFF